MMWENTTARSSNYAMTIIVTLLVLAWLSWARPSLNRWIAGTSRPSEQVLMVDQTKKEIIGSRQGELDSSLNRVFTSGDVTQSTPTSKKAPQSYTWIDGSAPEVSKYSSKDAQYFRIGTGTDSADLYKILQLDTGHLILIRLNDETLIPFTKSQ